MPLAKRCVSFVLPFALAAGVLGCGPGDGVQSYTVPKTTESGKSLVQPGAASYRILGALYPADRPEWYFKFTGSAAQVEAYEAEFDKLIKTVKFQADATAVPAFDLPAGWTKTGPRVVNSGGIQIKTDETIRFGPPAAPLEITVSYIPGGGIQGNLVRWAGQLGLVDFGPDEMAKATQVFDANGVKGLRVDLRGAKNPTGGMRGPFQGKQ